VIAACGLTIVWLLYSPNGAGAQQTSEAGAARAASIASRLSGGADWHARAKAFGELIELAVPGGLNGRNWEMKRALSDLFRRLPDRGDQLKLALAGALELENRRSTRMSEDQSDYYADLIGAVADIEDARAVRALIGAIDTGNMATSGLAVLGGQAIDAVLARLDDPAIPVRTGVTRTLVQMLEVGSVVSSDISSFAKLKAGLVRSTGDQWPHVRIVAIAGLARIPGSDVTAVLTALAQRDASAEVSPDTGTTSYPVREAAAKALLNRR
jgi:hypothetical protein